MGDGRRQNNGGCSKSWEEDIYWTHFQFIHFTQFLCTADFQQQLALPKTFSDNLKKKLPENVTLKGPSGVLWNIGLTTRNDTVYFADGWQRFVKDHSLKQNDFLVFKYNGESLFEVLIFDGESFCEKAASYFVLECGQAHTEQERNKGKNSNNSVEEVNTPSNDGVECASPEKFRRLDSTRTHLAVPFETTNGKTFTAGSKSASPEKVTADAIRITKTTSFPLPVQPIGGSKYSSLEKFTADAVRITKTPLPVLFPTHPTSGFKSASPEKVTADAVRITKTPLPIHFPITPTGKRTKKPVKEVTPVQTKKRGRPPKEANSWQRAFNKEHTEAALSKFSRKEEEKIAQSFTSSFPYFVKIIKTFHVGGSCILNVPYQFSLAHLPKGKIKIILLNMKGERWTVNSFPRAKSDTSHILCGGWMAFVHANSIKVGDVCIFELINECELRVRIAEVGKEGLDHENEHAKLISM